jgi:hypothetical protein
VHYNFSEFYSCCTRPNAVVTTQPGEGICSSERDLVCTAWQFAARSKEVAVDQVHYNFSEFYSCCTRPSAVETGSISELESHESS